MFFCFQNGARWIAFINEDQGGFGLDGQMGLGSGICGEIYRMFVIVGLMWVVIWSH